MTTEDDHDDHNEDNYYDHYDTTESDCNNDAVSLSTQSLLPTVQCCTHSCCHNMLEVSQPLEPLILKKTERLYGSIKRAFTPTWYKSYPWIHLCTSNFKVYCFYCKYVVHNLQIHAGTKQDPAFTNVGFSNWKKGVEKFKAHEASSSHKDACIVFQSSRGTSVANLMSNTIENDQSQRRNSFMKQLAALRFLLRQALPVRNDNGGGSNLSVLFESVLDESRWLKDGKYQSPEVINELIEIMAHKVLRSLLSDISSRKWYAIMADETRDISNREQLVLCNRSVSDNYVVHEDMVGLYQLDDTTSSTIHSCLKDSLLRMSLQIENCRGQAYDGAQPFQGHINGVAKKFKDSNASAISVHCLAHCVNLCLQEITRNSKPIKDALNFSMELIQLIKYSPKRQNVFERIKAQQSSLSTAGIRTLCPTRWTVRSGAMQAIISNYKVLQEAMEVSSHGSDDCSRRANGILALMERSC